MTTWQAPSSRPLSLQNIVLGVAIGLAILCAAITLVVVLERQRSEPELGSAIARLDEAQDELHSSARALREATSALQAATRAPTTVNVMGLPAPSANPVDPAAVHMRDAMTTPVADLSPQPALYCPVPERCVLPRAVLEQRLANPASLATHCHIMPSIRVGVIRGYKLYGVRPGSLPKELGLKNGDLVKSVNGIQLNSMEQAMSLYGKLRNADKFDLEIERKGELLRKEIAIQ